MCYAASMRKTWVFHDKDDPRFHAIGGEHASFERRAEIVAAGTRRHLELYPELRYLFCEHGVFVGANGCLRELFCELCRA